ncbi:MAG TPA: cytochrome D1 domain-containing protein [Pyrinomonadaceae bacterium]|nr:cytochrome D1 domain-containing protein [Pyrinomonadaceae bacterium]
MTHRIFTILMLLVAGQFTHVYSQQVFTEQGVTIEFSVAAKPVAGEEATVRFKITGANGGVPLSNLRPAAWIDQRETLQTPAARACRDKVQQFLQSSFTRRPTLDLNAYFVMALNNEPNISVIDPVLGFGGSKLYTLIALKSPGEDWVLSEDNKRVYVSLPASNQVAVIDVPTWTVIANIDAGVKPTRVALQHDQRYLWVGTNDGVAVIDTVTRKPVAQLKTGAGPHEIAFNDDDTIAFVANKAAGTVSLVDVRKLAVINVLKAGAQPTAIVYSSLSKTAYVASEADGSIVAIGGAKRDVIGRIQTEPGTRTLSIVPDGRYGFALNTARSTVYIFDLSSNRVVHKLPVGPDSDQISFTRQFAYVRSESSEFVTMIKLSDLRKEAAVTRFPAGQRAPRESPSTSIAPAIVPAPEDGAVLVANPADKTIYYYSEGMAAPMGSFQNYKRDPRALLVLDNSLRETERGVYTSTVRLMAPGSYDVVFLLDAPRLVNCFDLTVADNPALPKKVETTVKFEPLVKETLANAGERFTLRFKVVDTKSGSAKSDVQDIMVLAFLAPGIWQHREPAKPAADGVYEMSFVPPDPGVYYIFFQSPSLGIQFNQSTPLTLQVVKP